MVNAVHGIVDDLEKASARILRPTDAKGRRIPITEISTTMDASGAAILAAALLVGVGGGMIIASYLGKKK